MRWPRRPGAQGFAPLNSARRAGLPVLLHVKLLRHSLYHHAPTAPMDGINLIHLKVTLPR